MESIGGYRIIRRLGSGSRADVFLGHAGQGPDGKPELAAIKVFRDRTHEEGVDSEITALSRLNHPHIVRLLDLATGPRDVPCLILQRLEPSGLVRLLADRRTLEAGEAVTILAPIAAAVAAMHRAGVTHGRLGSAAVLFDSTGAPVLCGFGAADAATAEQGRPRTPAQLDEHPGVAADLDALTVLVTSVLSHVPDPAARADEFARWVGEQRRVAGYPAQLERGLFAFADPAPVTFSPEAVQPSVPHRFDWGGPDRSAVDTPAGPAVADWLAQLTGKFPTWLPDGLVEGLAGVPNAIRRVRRRVWVVAGIGVAAMVVAILLSQLPQAETQNPGPADGERIPVQPVAPSVAESGDPVTAALALLERRGQCLVERSILCLDAVHQADSAAWHADASRIQNVQEGGELVGDAFAPDNVTIIDRMGDTVLLAVGPADAASSGNVTASVLIIRTEAGWRIRSLLEGAEPLGGAEPFRG